MKATFFALVSAVMVGLWKVFERDRASDLAGVALAGAFELKDRRASEKWPGFASSYAAASRGSGFFRQESHRWTHEPMWNAGITCMRRLTRGWFGTAGTCPAHSEMEPALSAFQLFPLRPPNEMACPTAGQKTSLSV